MKYFAIPNLASQDAEVVDPLTTTPAEDFPLDKDEFNKWKSLPTTKHCFFSGCEGLTPSLRVTIDNPPKLLHGIVIEFDANIDDAMVALIPKNGVAGLLPTWVLHSRFRNGRRLVWEFESPIFVDNAELAERLIKRFIKEAHVKNLLPGMDDTGQRLTQYQELGKNWKRIPGSEPIKSNMLSAMFFKAASEKILKSDGPSIPIEAVAVEVERRWPGRWPGEFKPGARGPLFWIEDGIDRIGCQIGDHGVIAYSDRAGKSFLHWGEILGQEFVRNFEAEQIGEATENIWFDTQTYWSKLANGRWASNKKEDLGDDLQVKFGLKPLQVKEALSMVRNTHRITGVFPFVHNKSDVVTNEAGTFLNISARKLMQPAESDGEFPWLKEYFEKIWDPAHRVIQRDTFLAWFQRAYKSAYEGQLSAGHAVIIAGGTGLGKTLLNYKILGAAMGGYCDAASYLLGKTAFNKEAAECAHWTVDDDRGGANWESHDQFSNALKRFVANPSIPYHPKFKDEVTVPWRGRICVTCNLDLKSLSIIPEMDDSNIDKIMLFKLGAWKPKFKDIEQTITRELPYFLRWLLAWQPPKKVIGEERFGVVSYHHPDLLRESHDASPQGLLSEMLPFAIARMPNDSKDPERWMSATEIRAILDTEGLRSGLMKFAGNRLGIALSRVSKDYIKGTRIHRGIKQYLVNLRIND